MKSAAAVAVLLGAAIPTVSAWGATGHEAVAYIAQSYLSSDTISWAQNILDDNSDDYLANGEQRLSRFRRINTDSIQLPHGPTHTATQALADGQLPSTSSTHRMTLLTRAALTLIATVGTADASYPPSPTT